MKKNLKKGFTLVELLVVIAIIGVLSTMLVLMLTGPQKSARDGKRKSDIETMRQGLELYRSDCGQYPASLPAVGANLVGTSASASAPCYNGNVYIRSIPPDPQAGKFYIYSPGAGNTTYTICANLERGTGALACGSQAANSCGGTGCNYVMRSP